MSPMDIPLSYQMVLLFPFHRIYGKNIPVTTIFDPMNPPFNPHLDPTYISDEALWKMKKEVEERISQQQNMHQD